jgi:hypothetical protein
MSMYFIYLIRSQHCYIHFISTEDKKLGYVFYSTITEFINCLTILTNLLTIIFSIQVAEAEVAEAEHLIS